MPDISDLLKAGAGDPLAPLDLERAVRRGAQRARNRRVAQAAAGSGLVVVAAVAGLALAGGSPRAVQRQPLSTLLPDDSVPTSGPSADRPVPAADPSQLPDGINFVLVRSVGSGDTGVELTVDKVTRATDVTKQAKCAQADLGGFTPEQVFGYCWSNQNARLRVVPVDPGVRVLTPSAAGRATEVIALTVRDDVVVAMAPASDV